ncbi:hypothetical protein BJN45_14995 [Azonexus hydrophilus]|uniref:Phosphate ABC transporter substrate-binding protein n=2 Tax=Azonexus hydrophilus TaxID=418702 RepID=A0A1R1I1W0_9RHOO|nr:hypothetical protein BJN45_14995 [Azonexus hydrophilus]
MIRRFLKLLMLCLGCLGSGAVMAELVVVVNARSGVAAMTRNEVINVFFGRNRQFFNGLEAMPVDLEDSHPKRLQFYKTLVGKDLSEINAYWSRQIFTGRMQAPPRLESTEEVLKWVAARPGGIGFVELSRADARVRVVYELKP